MPSNNRIESLFEEVAQIRRQIIGLVSVRMEFRTHRIVNDNQYGIHGCSQQLYDVVAGLVTELLVTGQTSGDPVDMPGNGMLNVAAHRAVTFCAWL